MLTGACPGSMGVVAAAIFVLSPGLRSLSPIEVPLTTCLEPRCPRGRHMIAAAPVKKAISTYANFGWYDNGVSNASHFQRNSHTRISDNSWSVFPGLEM